MKKIIALIMALAMVAAMAACAPADNSTTTAPNNTTTTTPTTTGEQEAPVKVLTYEEYMAAAVDTVVTVETYVQAARGWWEGKITLYCQGTDGAYFLYDITCTEEMAAELTPGTKIRVTGPKAEWKGEIEIMGPDNSKLEIIDAEPYIAEAEDLTSLLANTEELIKKQNAFASFKGLTLVGFTYQTGEPGDGSDIYVTLSLDGQEYSFCVEAYLTGPDSDVYKAFSEGIIQVGDVVNIEGFVYWYDGVNTHITDIKKAA